jgi:hypothetical protein
MQRKLPMNPFHLATGVLLAALLASGAAAQFNTEALKKMQKEGHKIVEEQQAAEAAKPATGTQAAGAPLARHAYRFGADLCLDARSVLSVETCDGRIASQQWALDAGARLVATDGRCVDAGSLVPCSGAETQKWLHDKRGRLRNRAMQCLQVRGGTPGARVIAAPCSGVPAQVWTRLDLGG